jgi:presenilin-like A22 family membrane protease
MKMERTGHMDFRLFLILVYGLVQVTAIELGTRFDILGTVDEALDEIGQVNMLFTVGCLIVVVTLVLLLLIQYGLSRIFYSFVDYGLLWVAVALILLFLGQPWYMIVPVSSLAAVLQYTVSQFHHVSTGIFAVGSAAVLGSYFEVVYVVALFAFLILLDILSSRYIHHMPRIAKDMSEKNSVLMFRVTTKEGSSLVGCADIAFPCMLAVSAFTHSLEVGGVLASLLGLAGLLLAARHDEAHAGPFASLGILGLFIGYLVQHPECIDVLRTVTF